MKLDCVNYCCGTHGNCNYMSCSGSYVRSLVVELSPITDRNMC